MSEVTKFFRKANPEGSFAIEVGAEDGKPVVRGRTATGKWGTWKDSLSKIKCNNEDRAFFADHLANREDLELSDLL